MAFVSIVDYSFLPRLLRRFTQTYPGIRVALREATTDVQLQALARAEIDAGILLGPLVDAPVGGIALETQKGSASMLYQRLQAEALVLALPDSHARAKAKGPVALSGFAAEAFISFPRQTAPRLHDAIVGACGAAGFSPRIVQEAIQMQTIISLVSAGMGVALVPESLMSLKRPGVVYRKLRGKRTIALELGLASRRDNPSAALKHFTALAAQSAK